MKQYLGPWHFIGLIAVVVFYIFCEVVWLRPERAVPPLEPIVVEKFSKVLEVPFDVLISENGKKITNSDIVCPFICGV